ncbi:MAG: hypothetical protein J6T12_01545 [Salinivirgaceae bacterium]|nr:hypothetical protein [Salinivirgaceae bacterium]
MKFCVKTLLTFAMAFCVPFLPPCAGAASAQNGADAATEALISSDAVSSLLDSLKLTDDQQQRLDAARSVFETVKAASNTVKSLEDLFRKRELSLPVGVGDGEKYLICINEIYSDKDGNSHLKVSCIIPLNESGKQLAFDGEAIVEGQNGVGTRGRIELVAPLERKLGGESSVIFKAGTAVEFGCNGFEKLTAKLAFALKSSTIQTIDAAGKRTGRLRADMEADIDDIDNFTVSFGINSRFVMKGLDNYIFSISGATLDQSYTQTSAMVSFPDGYFEGGTDDDRNMWRGVAISQAEVQLPDFMSRQDTTKAPTPTRLSLSGVIIDGAGFSCHAAAQNVTSNSVKNDSWDLSVSDFEISLLRNQIKGVTFGGKINVPPLGESSKLDYAASLNIETNNYSIEAALPDSAEFPMLSGALEIASNSTIRVEIDGNKIKPELNLNGTISINAAIGGKLDDNRLTLPDIEFQQMRISPTDFSLGHVGLTGKLQTPNVAGFQLTVSEISSFETDDSTSAGLAVTAGVHVAEKFTGEAGLRLYGNIQKWKFSDVEIGKIHIGYEQNAFSLAGGIEFRSGDDTYGKGFRGNVEMKLLNGQLQVDAVAVFGKKDNFRYFLTDAFLETTPEKGVKVSFLNFYGVGGGLYSKMQQQRGKATCDFGESLSKINYVPDKDVSIGLMARTKFGFTGSDKLMDADVGLEIQFNKNWGVNFIQLRGDATFVCKDLGAGLAQSIKSNMDKIEGASKGVVEFKKEQLAEPKNDGVLRASMGMMFDIENETFTSDLKAYLNVGDILRGSGPNDQLGFASIYVSKDKWYTRIGTPDERCGVKLLGLAETSSYFMMGDDIPGLPDLPDEILNSRVISDAQRGKLTNRPDAGLLAEGKGIAMGSSLKVGFDATLKPFYASFNLGMGTEFLLKDYGPNVHCKGSSDPVGINGWYAQAQAWAYGNASVGMKVNLFKKSREFNIFKGGMVSYLTGAGPKPFYFNGMVGGDFNVLNGLVKGRFTFDFQIGDTCQMVGGSPFGENVIAQLTPDGGSTDVNVFIAPQLVLNVPANQKMDLDDGCTYRIDIDEFTITNLESNTAVEATMQTSDDNRTFTYKLKSPLESRQKHKVQAKVSFKKLSGGKWETVKNEDGTACVETKTVEFTSGDRPDYIMPEHVLYSYPADRQYNFYSSEHSEVYLLVEYDYSYLFTTQKPKDCDQLLQLTPFGGKAQTTTFNYTTSPRQTTDPNVQFEVYASTGNLSFSPDVIYHLAIINKPTATVAKTDANIKATSEKIADTRSDMEKTTRSAEGTIEMLETTMIYELDFRTSAYTTFKAKMAQMTVGSIVAWQEYPYVYNLKTNILDNCSPTENFDYAEYMNYSHSGNIKIKPAYSQTPWYVNKVKPLMYGNTDLRNLIGSIEPPTNDSIMYWYSSFSQLNDNIIETNGRQSISRWNTLNNHMQKYIDNDLCNYRTIVANKLAKGAARTVGVQTFMNANNIPPTIAGVYPVIFEYTLPGKSAKTSEYQINLEYK